MGIKRIAFALGLILMLWLMGSAFVAQTSVCGNCLSYDAAHRLKSAPQPAARQLTDQEKRGKFIYLRGGSPSGREITCYIGDGATEVPAAAMLCANCHGFDGRGNPEGGVVPSDITWEALTKYYGVTHSSGRKHPAYT